MTVKELIDLLSNFKQDTQVLTRGYESGYEDVLSVEVRRVVKEPTRASYEGLYQDVDVWEDGGEVRLYLKGGRA
jgi:hypothetical protein